MRSAILIALFAAGCGGCGADIGAQPDPATDSKPLTCEAPSGAYLLKWQIKNGNCGAIEPSVGNAPSFGCKGSLSANMSGNACIISGDVTCDGAGTAITCKANCAPSLTKLRCRPVNGETRCDASVTKPDCSGEYALTMTRVE